MTNKRLQILKTGLPWGLGMFIIMTFVFPYLNREVITLKKILIAFPFWMLGGLLFGYSMNRRLPNQK
jgi:hypothetical protein|tara:strand:- start:432 stop:632 length:201 start_codon:yes stop_codon:yes gene_type:complete